MQYTTSEFHRAVISIHEAGDEEAVFRAANDAASVLLGCDRTSILGVIEDGAAMRIRAATGLSDETIRTAYIPVTEDSISGWVGTRKEPLLVEDIEKDPRFKKRSGKQYTTRSFLSVPVIRKGCLVGVINASNRRDQEVFGADDMEALAMVSEHLALALDNMEVRG